MTSPHQPFRALLVGDGTLLVQCADVLRSRDHLVVGILTSDPAISRWARQHGIPYAANAEALAADGYDLLFSIANLRMLPARLIERAAMRAINFHDGPLPRYAGLYATSWSLLAGEARHGVSWHEMTGEPDAGRMLVQREVDIADDETAFTLNAKCYEAGRKSFVELIEHLERGRLAGHEQDLARRTYFGRRDRPPAAGVIAWDRSARYISTLVRALDFGPYPNAFAAAKVLLGDACYVVLAAEPLPGASRLDAGRIDRLDSDALEVATTDGTLALRRLATLEGRPASVAELRKRHGLEPGLMLPSLTEDARDRLTSLHRQICVSEPFWVERFTSLRPVPLPLAVSSTPGPPRFAESRLRIAPESGLRNEDLPTVMTAGAAAYLARLSGTSILDFAFDTPVHRAAAADLGLLVASSVPMRVEVDAALTFGGLLRTLEAERERLERHRTYLTDLAARYPALAAADRRTLGETIRFCWVSSLEDRPSPSSPLTVYAAPGEVDLLLAMDTSQLDVAAVERLFRNFACFLSQAVGHPDRPLATHALVDPEEQDRLRRLGTGDERVVDVATIHRQFERQAHRIPDEVALCCQGRTVTYRELDERTNRLARYLGSRGVVPGALVGIATSRSLDMVVAMLGVLKAGAAYVPLDPGYPPARLAIMAADAKLALTLSDMRSAAALPAELGPVVRLDSDWPPIEAHDPGPLGPLGDPDHLAYVIFTSGSTGRPKGVMISHGNVANYFAGMDEILAADGTCVWLAVTSISFDISVQEILWPLTRGHRVVIATGEDRQGGAAKPQRRPLDFSLFYFASDEEDQGVGKYTLLLDGARFADERGFAAVWTPERHFHRFGGLYPNPSVASAALATITNRIHLRAGSVVSPLHSPIRIAEEWALVDNLSRGRVGLSFASGWHADDFVLRPDLYADRKNQMFRDLDTVRRLWRGEAVRVRNGAGNEVEVRVLPRPVQAELPVWITAAGSPETFRRAGEAGAGVLTHLLGQRLDELGEKLQAYREAWMRARHPGDGHVVLMLHTFVGETTDAVREIVREPFSRYLRSSVDLIRSAPAAFPTHRPPAGAQARYLDKGLEATTDEDMTALLRFAFDRYFETSGLFGSVDRCLETVEAVRALGVDELACLIDFGVAPSLVLPSLRLLDEVRTRARAAPSSNAATGDSIPELIARYAVTHLQCTPSMARILTADAAGRAAVSRLTRWLVGGEALSESLASVLVASCPGKVLNMYGPTETTIWSTSFAVTDTGAVSLGKPLANQWVALRSPTLHAVPGGVAGELYIGGRGVAVGYLSQPALTAQRFVTGDRGLEYRTGDLARVREDGSLEFLGRLDDQVKVRGFRIELGDIEHALVEHEQITEAVVCAREDSPGDQRLVAYLVPTRAPAPSERELAAFLAARLPDHMIPASFVTLAAWPLTPNGKIDRRALPAPGRASRQPSAAPERGSIAEQIASVLAEALGTERVGLHDNFFDLGAHSLMIVQVHARLQDVLERSLSLIELFRYPTVSALAAHLAGPGASPDGLAVRSDRAARRRESMVHRRERRAVR